MKTLSYSILRLEIVSLAALLVCFNVFAEMPSNQPQEDGVEQIKALRTGAEQAFQFRIQIDTGAEQLYGAVSWAPPDRRACILCDKVDGLPLMIAVDGKVWMYDLIGGQILEIRAEPEVISAVRDGSGVMRYGMRADFPTDRERTTLELDFAAVLKENSAKQKQPIIADSRKRSFSIKSQTETMILETLVGQPKLPGRFVLRVDQRAERNRWINIKFDEFRYDQDAPPWHRGLDFEKLGTKMQVLKVSESDSLNQSRRELLGKIKGFIQGGGLFILRTSIRDQDLQAALKKNSQIELDFAQMQANDRRMKEMWINALREQEFQIPPVPASEPEEGDETSPNRAK